MVWAVAYECAQPYNSGSDSHRRRDLFRPQCDSSAWAHEHGFDLTGVRRRKHESQSLYYFFSPHVLLANKRIGICAYV